MDTLCQMDQNLGREKTQTAPRTDFRMADGLGDSAVVLKSTLDLIQKWKWYPS
jgi:hypothetical protein